MTNLRRLACKFDLDQSERKSSQVNASARKAWPNGVASRRKLRTYVYLRLCLARAYIRWALTNRRAYIRGDLITGGALTWDFTVAHNLTTELTA